MPYYKLHKYYGLAVALTPPFHILCLPFAWAAMLNKGNLSKQITRLLQLVNFSIFTLFSGTVFIAVNLVMLPFAYLKTVLVKLTLSYKGVIKVTEFLIFFLIGMPLLLVMQVMDFVAYIQWSSVTKDPDLKDRPHILSREQFEMFYEMVLKIAKQLQGTNKSIKSVDFLKKVQSMMEVDMNVFKMIYGTTPGN